MVKRRLELRHRELVLFEHQLLDRVEGVRHIGDTEALRAGEVVHRTAALRRQTATDEILHHRGLKRQGATLRVRDVNRVIRVNHQADEVFRLLLVGLVKFLKGRHLGNIAGGDTHHLAVVHTVVEHQLHHAAHIEERGIVPTLGLAGALRLDAADDAVVTGILGGEAAADQRGNDDLVVVIGGQADTRTSELRRLDTQIVRGSVPQTNRQRRTGKHHVH